MKKLRLTKEQSKTLIVAFFSAFVCFFNQTTINPALPTIISDFNITPATAQWLLSGYLMVMAIVIPINAYLIEKFPVKKILIFSMGVYTIGCVVTGSGIDFTFTLIGRLLQGLGHGLMMPSCMAVMLFIFPKEKRGFALGMFGLLIGLAPILGPTYSGIMVDNISWHFVYYGIAIVSLICFICCIFVLPNVTLTDKNENKLDPISLITSCLGFGLILYSCSEYGEVGFNIFEIITLIAGIIIVAYFFYRQSKIEHPMLEVKCFKYRNFTISIIILVICQLAFMGAIVLFPFLIQDVLGFSPTVSGLVMIPSSLVMGTMSPVTGKLFDKYGIRWLSIIGMFILAAAGFLLSFVTETSPIYLLIIFLCARSLGASFVLMNINTWGINALPNELLPHGNALSTTFRQIAMSFAAAISTSVYASVASMFPGGLDNPASAAIGIDASFAYQAVLCVIGLILCIIFVKEKKQKS